MDNDQSYEQFPIKTISDPTNDNETSLKLEAVPPVTMFRDEESGVIEKTSDSNAHLSMNEVAFMEKAFFYAREALSLQEVPVGCIFVHNNQIIALGRNTVNETHNATRHAEINCIEQVHTYCEEKRLDLRTVFSEVCVYVTVEPCIMCAAALYELNVNSIVFGCKNDRFGGQTVLNVGTLLKPMTTVKGGYREEEAMNLLKTFYKGTNPNAPTSKAKVKKDVS